MLIKVLTQQNSACGLSQREDTQQNSACGLSQREEGVREREHKEVR